MLRHPYSLLLCRPLILFSRRVQTLDVGERYRDCVIALVCAAASMVDVHISFSLIVTSKSLFLFSYLWVFVFVPGYRCGLLLVSVRCVGWLDPVHVPFLVKCRLALILCHLSFVSFSLLLATALYPCLSVLFSIIGVVIYSLSFSSAGLCCW